MPELEDRDGLTGHTPGEIRRGAAARTFPQGKSRAREDPILFHGEVRRDALRADPPGGNGAASERAAFSLGGMAAQAVPGRKSQGIRKGTRAPQDPAGERGRVRRPRWSCRRDGAGSRRGGSSSASGGARAVSRREEPSRRDGHASPGARVRVRERVIAEPPPLSPRYGLRAHATAPPLPPRPDRPRRRRGRHGCARVRPPVRRPRLRELARRGDHPRVRRLHLRRARRLRREPAALRRALPRRRDGRRVRAGGVAHHARSRPARGLLRCDLRDRVLRARARRGRAPRGGVGLARGGAGAEARAQAAVGGALRAGGAAGVGPRQRGAVLQQPDDLRLRPVRRLFQRYPLRYAHRFLRVW